MQAGLLQKGVCHLWEDLKTGVRITAGHGGAPHLSSVLLAPAVRRDLRTQWGGGWNWVIFTVPSYPNHSKILQTSTNMDIVWTHGCCGGTTWTSYGHMGAVGAPMLRASAILSLTKQSNRALSLSHPEPAAVLTFVVLGTVGQVKGCWAGSALPR